MIDCALSLREAINNKSLVTKVTAFNDDIARFCDVAE